MTAKFWRLWLFALLLLPSLAACFRPAGDVIEPTPNTEPIIVDQPPTQTVPTVEPAALTAEAGGAAAVDDLTEAADEVEPTDLPRPTQANATPAATSSGGGGASTPRLAITIVPPATSTTARDAQASLEQTAAVTTPSPTVIFTTPRIPAGPFTPAAPERSAFTEGTEEADTLATPSGLITPTDFFDPNDEACFYTVESGDNLYRIALSNGFSEAEMREANPELAGANPILQPGQRLRLPGCGVRPPDEPVEEAETPLEDEPADAGDSTLDVPPGGEIYEVTFGDTLTTIANRFGVSVQQIVEANDLANPDRLQVGQELIIPPSD